MKAVLKKILTAVFGKNAVWVVLGVIGLFALGWLAMTIYERRLKQKIRRDSWEQFERWLAAQDPRPSAEEEQALRRKQEAEIERLLADLDADR